MKQVGKGFNPPSIFMVIIAVSVSIIVAFNLPKSPTSPTTAVVASPQPVLYEKFYHGEIVEVAENNMDYFVIYISPKIEGDEQTSLLYKKAFGDKVPVIVPRELWLTFNDCQATYRKKNSTLRGNRRTLGPVMNGDIITYVQMNNLSQDGAMKPVLMMTSWKD